jgi:hypothetical protein
MFDFQATTEAAPSGSSTDLTGRRFGRLTVTARAVNSNTGKHRWFCECDCGKEVVVFGGALRSGNTQSCGCFRREKSSRNSTSAAAREKIGTANSTHRASATAEYRAWGNMKSRCYNPRVGCYPYYGGRGIRVCEQWLDNFENFLADVGPRPSPLHSIDRFPNGDGNYEPENVRWATKAEQTNNVRRNTKVFYLGAERNLVDAIRLAGNKIGLDVARKRIKAGWPAKAAVETPPDARWAKNRGGARV